MKKPAPDRYQQITNLFANTGYEAAFRYWFELQDIDPAKTTKTRLEVLRGQWLIDRRHHIAQLFKNTNYGSRFRQFFHLSGRDPRTTTRRQLHLLWLEWKDIEEEVAIIENEREMKKAFHLP